MYWVLTPRPDPRPGSSSQSTTASAAAARSESVSIFAAGEFDRSRWPFAYEGERAGGWEGPDVEAVPPAAAASSAAGGLQKGAFGFCVGFLGVEPIRGAEVGGFATVTELDAESQQLSRQLFAGRASPVARVMCHEERMLELFVVEAVADLHLELEAVRKNGQGGNPDGGFLAAADDEVERDRVADDGVGRSLPGATGRLRRRLGWWGRRFEERPSTASLAPRSVSVNRSRFVRCSACRCRSGRSCCGRRR
jgi:hypothetical protein